MKNNSEYMSLVKEARKKQLKLTQSQYSYIRNLYKDASKQIKSIKAKKGSLTERWLKDYQKAIDKEIETLNKILYKNNRGIINKSAEYAANIQLDFFCLIDNKYNLGMDKTFRTVFSRVPNNAVIELLNGNLYKDNKGLSQRIWSNGSILDKDLQYIINKGIIEKKSAYELAQDISMYVDPNSKKSWAWKKVYPGVGNRKVDYNAQRLARTAINHAFFMNNISGCSRNPYVEAMHWELSHSHYERQIKKWGPDECDDYAEQNNYSLGVGNFPINELPLPHPQCLCSQYAVIPKSMEEIGTELRNWLDGKSNPMLDNWYSKYGAEFAGLNNAFYGKNSNSNKNNETGATKYENSGIIKVGCEL